MTLGEWSGAAVEPTTGRSAPVSDEWRRVELPGSPSAFAGADCVAYRTRFPDPRVAGETRALLTLRGAYARSRVWVNGELLGEHDAYFEPARFVFDPEPDNELIVECRAPGDRFGGVHDSPLVPDEAATPAVWWGADVTGLPPVALVDVTVEPRREGGVGYLDATIAVDAARDVDDRITFSIRPRGFRGGGAMERAPLSLPAGSRRTVEHTVEIPDPQVWRPRGHGPQQWYGLAAKYEGREVAVETGFASVARDEEGLLVDGERVPARGFATLPSVDPGADVERAVEANANLLRAHAHVPPRSFHRACVEAGVLVWQDLPLTGEGGYDIDRGRELAGRLDRLVGHSPAVAAYGVHDDPRELYPSPLGGGRTGRLRLRWRAWRAGYNASPDESVAEAFPDDVPTLPVSGAYGIDPDAVHLYPGWDYAGAGDLDWLLDGNASPGAVVGEFGAGALVEADGGDAAGFDRGKHDARVGGGVDDSQAYQAAVLKRVAEGLRRRGAHALAAFALRDADDGAGMGVLARDGAEKRGFEAIAAAYEPVQAVLDGAPSGTVGTTVLNDTPDPVEATLEWSAGDRDGAAEVSVDPLGRADGPDVSVPRDAESVDLSLRTGDGAVENHYPR